jgi:hypothetical protein
MGSAMGSLLWLTGFFVLKTITIAAGHNIAHFQHRVVKPAVKMFV